MKKTFGIVVGVSLLTASVVCAESVTQQVEISADAAPVCSAPTMQTSWHVGKITNTDTGTLKTTFTNTVTLGNVTCSTDSYLGIQRSHEKMSLNGTGICSTSGIKDCIKYGITAIWARTGYTPEEITSEQETLTANSELLAAGSGPLTLRFNITETMPDVVKGGLYSDSITVRVGTTL